MVRGINDPQLRSRALERQIDLVGEATKRARATWLVAMVMTFVIAASMFNATMSWNNDQIARRSWLLGVVSSNDLLGIWKEIKSKDYAQAAFINRAGELGNLKDLLPPEERIATLTDDQKKEALASLRRAVEADLQTYVQRRTQFDTVAIPFIGVSIAASDIGIVGGLAISIVGFWLLASLRRENHAMAEFIRRDEDGGNFSTDFSGCTPEENIHAYRGIMHVMVFSVSTKESVLNYATIGSFIAAPLIFLTNHILSVVMLYRRGLGDYVDGHFLLELVMAITVTLVWLKALIYQMRTLSALQAWNGIVDGLQERSTHDDDAVTDKKAERRRAPKLA